MSQYAINRGCDECHKLETGLVEIKIGGKQLLLCYPCTLKFCLDMENFRKMNFSEEELKKGEATV